MSQPYAIRPLESADFAAFLDIQGDALKNAPEIFGSDYDWFDSLSILSKEQRYEKFVLFPYQYLLAAVSADRTILGMVGFSCDHHLTKLRHKGRIWGLYVRPAVRGHGIASALVRNVIMAAEEIGCEQIQLSVSTNNKDSYSLYLRLGFSVYGTESHAVKLQDGYVDEYLMSKFLR
ncbi:MAG: GNAT family N-acetyltransferase [Bradyrhizobiaceae bacterium]|nr:GNAT family N-acetyltransferase [Bradyrhizobiaceae bacterium]